MHVLRAHSPGGAPPNFPTRRSYFAIGVGVAAFALYGSLLPFEIRPIPLESAWANFTSTILGMPRRVSRSDVLANVLLFVPLGFCLAGALLVDRRHSFALVRAAIVILPVGLILSVTLEFLQTFVSDRIPSSVDVAAQTIGALVGIGLWIVVGNPVTHWLRQTAAAVPGDRLSRVLLMYVVAWIFVNLAPFDITVDIGDLARRLKSGKIAVLPFAGADWRTARFAWDAMAEALSAIPLGAAGLLTWRRSRTMAFAYGATVVTIVEFLQIFIRSHAAIATDVMFAGVGVAIGVCVSGLVSGRTVPAGDARSAHLPAGALAAVAAWVLVLCAYHWVPYEFAFDHEEIRRKLASVSLLPFAGYRAGSDLNAFNDILTKLGLAAPLGLLVARAFRTVAGRWTAVATLLVSALVLAAIELGQFFLPQRVPDPTDVLVGAGAAFGGARLAKWLWAVESSR